MVKTVHVQTTEHCQMLNITGLIADCIPHDFSGVCVVFCVHTTAGLTINENTDPDVVTDMLEDLERHFPTDRPYYKHVEGNSAAHLKSSIIGCSQMIPVESGSMRLGTWQGIYFCEFDGPRQRRVLIELLPAAKYK